MRLDIRLCGGGSRISLGELRWKVRRSRPLLFGKDNTRVDWIKSIVVVISHSRVLHFRQMRKVIS
jgi:hypothetical protein